MSPNTYIGDDKCNKRSSDASRIAEETSAGTYAHEWQVGSRAKTHTYTHARMHTHTQTHTQTHTHTHARARALLKIVVKLTCLS